MSTYIVYSIEVNMNLVYIYIYSHVISTVYIYASISVNHGDMLCFVQVGMEYKG